MPDLETAEMQHAVFVLDYCTQKTDDSIMKNEDKTRRT